MSAAASRVLADNGLDITRVPRWLNDPSNWRGQNGLLIHIREHLVYTGIAVVIAAIIAIPLGLVIGHTGKGVAVVVGLANALRAVPAFGLLLLLVVWISPSIHIVREIPGIVQQGGLRYFIPVELVLIILAVPPILSNTYAGVQNVDRAVTDAARGMGMKGAQIVRKVEFPIALPLIMAGLRSATLQVIATATIAAFVPFLGGLGRLIVDGSQQLFDPVHGYSAMVGAGIVVAALAVVIDTLLMLIQRLVVSPGVSGRFSTRKTRPSPITASIPEVQSAAR